MCTLLIGGSCYLPEVKLAQCVEGGAQREEHNLVTSNGFWGQSAPPTLALRPELSRDGHTLRAPGF